MTDFRIDIVGTGPAVTLCPVGTLDAAAASVLLEALEAVRGDAGALVAVQLDGVEHFTEGGLARLARADLLVEDRPTPGPGPRGCGEPSSAASPEATPG